MSPEAEQEWRHEFGRRLRTARQAAGLRQSDLGAVLGLARSSVSNLEAGRQTPDGPMVAMLAATLAVEPPGWKVDPSTTAELLQRQRAEIGRLRTALWSITEHVQGALRAGESLPPSPTGNPGGQVVEVP